MRLARRSFNTLLAHCTLTLTVVCVNLPKFLLRWDHRRWGRFGLKRRVGVSPGSKVGRDSHSRPLRSKLQPLGVANIGHVDRFNPKDYSKHVFVCVFQLVVSYPSPLLGPFSGCRRIRVTNSLSISSPLLLSLPRSLPDTAAPSAAFFTDRCFPFHRRLPVSCALPSFLPSCTLVFFFIGQDHQEGDPSAGVQGVQDEEAAGHRALQALRARREEAGDRSPVLSFSRQSGFLLEA